MNTHIALYSNIHLITTVAYAILRRKCRRGQTLISSKESASLEMQTLLLNYYYVIIIDANPNGVIF